MVMVAIPLRKELFASKAIPVIICALARGERPKIPRSTFHDAVKVLRQADILGNDLSIQVPLLDDRVVLNTRDYQLARIFCSPLMGAVLDKLSSGRSFGVRELASTLKANLSSVQRVLVRLRSVGLVQNGGLSSSVVYHPAEPADEVPRLKHRKAVKYFLSFLNQEDKIEAVIVYGDAAVGKPSPTVEILTIRRLTKPIVALEELETVNAELAGNMAEAANQVATAYPPLRLDLSIVGAFDWQSYELISKPMLSPRLYRASQGIVVYGDATVNLTKLMGHWRMMVPLSPDDLARGIERGHIAQTEKGLEATMKWVDEYLAPATTKASEDEIIVTLPDGATKMTVRRIVLVKGREQG